MLGPDYLLYELGRAEISVRSKRTKSQLSLLDIIEKEDQELLFNSCENIRSYRLKLISLHIEFKSQLDEIPALESKEQKKLLKSLMARINELNVLLNPKDEDLLFARVDLPGKLRYFDDQDKLTFIRKKCLKYLGLQREIFRLTRLTFKGFIGAADLVHKKRKRKKSQGQVELQFEDVIHSLKWEIEPVKLIELIAALSETNAFGKSTSRKELWSFFENQFSIQLKNPESSLHQMKNRKSTSIRFLDELKEEFKQLMDE